MAADPPPPLACAWRRFSLDLASASVDYKQPPEGPSTEDPSTQESHPDHARVSHKTEAAIKIKNFRRAELTLIMEKPHVFGNGRRPWKPISPKFGGWRFNPPNFSGSERDNAINQVLSDPTEITLPPYRETGVATPLSHCVSWGIANYRCYTPTSFRKNCLSQSKDSPNKESQKKLASEAYCAIWGRRTK